MLIAMQTQLPMTEIVKLGMNGLGAYATLSSEDVFALLRPYLKPGYVSNITDDQLREMIASLYGKYVVLKGAGNSASETDVAEDIKNAALKTLGPATALAYAQDLKAAFSALKQNYSIVLKGAATDSPRQPDNQQGSRGTSSGSGSSVADSVSGIGKRLEAAILAIGPSSKKRKTKPNSYIPLIVGGAAVLLLGIALIRRK